MRIALISTSTILTSGYPVTGATEKRRQNSATVPAAAGRVDKLQLLTYCACSEFSETKMVERGEFGMGTLARLGRRLTR